MIIPPETTTGTETDVKELSSRRCFNHVQREAAAVCPGCRRFFCRECITEHDDMVICSSCLADLVRKEGKRGLRLGWLVASGRVLAGLLAAWIFFYFLGQALLSIPSSFHEGAIWEKALQRLNE